MKGIGLVGIAVFVAILIVPAAVFGGAQKEAAGTEGVQKVSFMTLDVVNFRGALQEFIDEFEANNPDIDIEPNWSGQLGTALTTAMESGSEPDITFIWSPALVPYIRQKRLAQVPPDVEAILRSDLHDYSLRPATWEGKLYSVPYNYYPSFGGILVNVDIWEEAGIDPRRAKTWDDLMAVAQKVTERDPSGRMTQAGFSAERDPDSYFYAWILQEGGQIFNPDGTAAFNSPTGQDALRRYVEIYTKWKVDDPEFGQTTDEFKKGTVAMTNGMPWFASIVAKDTPNINFDFLDTPTIGRSDPYWALFEVWMHGVSTKSADKEGVWRFLKYLVTTDVASRFSAFSGELSSVKAASNTSRVIESPFVGPFVDLMPYGKAEHIIEFLSSDVTEALRQTMADSVIIGGASVEDAIETAAKEVNRINARLR